MRAFVFTDKTLERRAGQFVWLSINTEKAGNSGVLSRFPVEAWPSFFVIDPRTEKVSLRWVGGATLPQVERLLDDGRRAVTGGGKGLEEILARADRLYGEKQNAQAAAAYREALEKAPPNWKPRARAMESLLFALQSTRDFSACADTARSAFDKLAQTPSAANVAAIGLDCALSIDANDPRRSSLVAALAADARQVIDHPRPGWAADDVSSVYDELAQERSAAKDESGRRDVLNGWARFLEGETSRAKTPEARAVFDSHRVSVYLALGEPERAVPMLEASQRDLPDDYNPPARLAAAYKAMKRWDDALTAIDQALAKAYGPRKVGFFGTRADILAAKGDTAGARQTLEEGIRFAEALPAEQRSDRTIAALKKKLAEVS
jgi:tetratricopeptide (TPR) repeat protein